MSVEAIQTLLAPPTDGRLSVRSAADAIRSASKLELARATKSLGHEAVGLARAHAHALGDGPFEKVIESARQHVNARPLALELAQIAVAAARCRDELARIVGTSSVLADLRRAVFVASFGRSLHHTRRVARVIRDHDVLITGETGTGKEQVAAAILAGTIGGANGSGAAHFELNVAAIPETLVESELFGHRKGSFTGAVADRKGAVRTADGGCLFLDEVGELPLQVQVKLLRVIETDRVQPIGSDSWHSVDVRFIAATHRDLPSLVRDERFRQDLYQRLAGTVLHVPPLRERPEDLIAIGDHFLDGIAYEGSLDDEIASARGFLRSPAARIHAFPGNVRELKNVLRNLLLGLPAGIGERAAAHADDAPPDLPNALVSGTMSLAELEAWYLRRTLARTRGNLAATARVLGIDRTTAARKARALD